MKTIEYFENAGEWIVGTGGDKGYFYRDPRYDN